MNDTMRDPDLLDDPRWDQLARGVISAEDRADLERLAETNAEAREALALFTPLGPEAEERLVTAVAAEVAKGRPRSKLLFFRKAAPVMAALAMAAGVALFIGARSPEGALPAYAMAVAGGAQIERSDPSPALPTVAAGSRVVVTLRPDVVVAGQLAARVYWVQDGRAQPIEVEVQTSPDGALRCVGRLGAARPGAGEIVAVVARPEALPAPDVDAASLAAGDARRRVTRAAVQVVESR